MKAIETTLAVSTFAAHVIDAAFERALMYGEDLPLPGWEVF